MGEPQFGEGVSVERGREGGLSGGVVGCRTEVGVGKSSMWWSGSAQSWRSAGTKTVWSLWMSSHRLRPASLATTTKSTGHLAGERLVCSMGVSRDVSAGANRI